MKEFYFLYKEKETDISYKHEIIDAASYICAIDYFYNTHPDVIFAAMYDKDILPFLKSPKNEE